MELPRRELRTAEERLKKAVRREPYLAAGWRVLGQTLEQDGRLAESEQSYRDRLGYQGGDPILHEHLGLLLVRRGTLDEAEAHLRDALRLLPRPPASVHDGLASVHVRRGEWAAAEARAREAVDLEPSLASAWNNLAIALEEQGRPDEAHASRRTGGEALANTPHRSTKPAKSRCRPRRSISAATTSRLGADRLGMSPSYVTAALRRAGQICSASKDLVDRVDNGRSRLPKWRKRSVT